MIRKPRPAISIPSSVKFLVSDIQYDILLGDDFLDVSWNVSQSNPDLWLVKRFQSELVLLRKVTCSLSSVLLAHWCLNLRFFGKSRVRYAVCCVRSWVPELVLLRKVVPLLPRLPLRCQRLVRSVQLRELVLGVGLVWMQLLIGMTIQFILTWRLRRWWETGASGGQTTFAKNETERRRFALPVCSRRLSKDIGYAGLWSL